MTLLKIKFDFQSISALVMGFFSFLIEKEKGKKIKKI